MKKKILLIHGWNYRNYTKLTKETDAWHNREELIKTLSEEYEVIKINLPGFCGEKEPAEKEWNLNNYASYVENYLQKNNLNIDYILGYSFGGAVAIRWKTLYQKNSKLILISPAIIRAHGESKKFIKTPKLLSKIRKIIRNLYVSYILKTNEMRYGTRFLRNSYQLIVREDLTEEVKKISSNEYIIIYGEIDDQVNPKLLYNNLDNESKKRVKFIKHGGHDIANTHYKDIIDIINKFAN